jgi:uncharacterized phage protein (TIGR01671 family)
MMREFKFRAWDSERKEMVYGEEIEESSQPYIEEGEHVCDTTRYFTGLSYGKLFVAYYKENGDWDECNLMQFSALYDKNGKEIYEKDIVKIWMEGNEFLNSDGFSFTAQINYHGGAFWFDGISHMITDCNWHHYNASDREIIGNIYENPELIEEARNAKP